MIKTSQGSYHIMDIEYKTPVTYLYFISFRGFTVILEFLFQPYCRPYSGERSLVHEKG